jgi:hypothetical protein
LPCIAALPSGWDLEHVHVARHRATFTIASERAGNEVRVALEREGGCDLPGVEPVPTDEAGTRRFERPDRLVGGLRDTRVYEFEGGCVTYRYAFAADASPSLVFEVDRALGFVPREDLVDQVRSKTDLRLCGAGVPCPGGSR